MSDENTQTPLTGVPAPKKVVGIPFSRGIDSRRRTSDSRSDYGHRIKKQVLEMTTPERALELLEKEVCVEYRNARGQMKKTRGKPEDVAKKLIFQSGDARLIWMWVQANQERAHGRPYTKSDEGKDSEVRVTLREVK